MREFKLVDRIATSVASVVVNESGQVQIMAEDYFYSGELSLEQSAELAIEVINRLGSSEEDRLRLQAVVERVSKLPHLMKTASDPIDALGKMVDLLDAPNNLDALWVWSEFSQCFGQGNTWQAERALNVLLNWTATRRVLIESIAKGENDADIESLKTNQREAELHCFTMLEHVLDNFRKWPDLPEFAAHRRSLEPTEAKPDVAQESEVKS